MYRRLLRYANWLGLVATSAAGLAIVLAISRRQPAVVHAALASGPSWLRIAATLAASQLLVVLLIRLTKPNIRHLVQAFAVPPVWAAVLVGTVIVYCVDTTWTGLIGGYPAQQWEWIVYAIAPLALAGLHGTISKLAREENDDVRRQASESIDEAAIESGTDHALAAWLDTERPAAVDRLGTQPIADRIAKRLSDGSHSIGLVGPFGSGKTTVVNWVEEKLRSCNASRARFSVHRFSAWEFDQATSAVEAMLDRTVGSARKKIDTSMLESLPDSYRETFSAAGSWARSLQTVLLGHPDAIEQFTNLNDYLRLCDLTVVLIVEDLDRVDGTKYQLAELFGFLDRLRSLDRINFLLTGARSASHQIDFQKLCDYVELIPPLNPQSTTELLTLFRGSFKESGADRLESIPNARQENPWETHPLSSRWEAFTLIDAATRLLSTARATRHALSRTRLTWGQLKGEIDFDDLLALNVLRYGAPEVFGFLLEHHDRLRQPCPRDGDFGASVTPDIKLTLQSAWKDAVRTGGWQPAAAEKLMYFLFPTAAEWLGDAQPSSSRIEYAQAIAEDRYWRRLLSEAVPSSETRDQEVVAVSRAWLNTNATDNRLVSRISDSQDFANVWASLCQPLFYRRTAKARRLICELVRIALERDGSEAAIDSANLWYGFRGVLIPLREHAPDVWFKELLTHISECSLNLACEVWHHFGERSEQSILSFDRANQVWIEFVDLLRDSLAARCGLTTNLPLKQPFALYRLVEASNKVDKSKLIGGSWGWLVDSILEGLNAQSRGVALNTACLFLRREGGNQQIDTELLGEIFGTRSDELSACLSALECELPDEHLRTVNQLIDAARSH